jgi:hypothetical protein
MRSCGGVAAAVLIAVLSVVASRALAETDEDGRDAPLNIARNGTLGGAEATGRVAALSVAAERALAGPDADTRDAASSLAPDRALAKAAETGQGSARFLLFSSTDLWRHGGFAHGGVLWSPHGLDQEGFVLKLTFGGGLYRYHSGALDAEVVGRQFSAAILPGWRFIRSGFIVTVFVGPEIQSHRLSPDDPSAGLRGNYVGARAGFELWYQPSAATMVAADASVSTIGLSYSARLAGGWRMLDLFYLGPELQAFAADSNYRQFRAGLHGTGLRTGAYEWSAGLGWAGDSDRRSSVYGKFGMLTRR